MNNTPLAGNQPHCHAQLPPEAAQGANGFSIGGVPMGFTKLDQMILQSSVMAESPEVFKVWIALLAACGPDSVARVSAVYLSSICRLSQEVVDAALKKLTEPDEHSRTPDNDGRRIERCDGGWHIYNYLKYRAKKVYSDSPQAIRQRKHRDKGVTSCDKSVTGRDFYASASASSESLPEAAQVLSRPNRVSAAAIAVFVEEARDKFWNADNKYKMPQNERIAAQNIIHELVNVDGYTFDDIKNTIDGAYNKQLSYTSFQAIATMLRRGTFRNKNDDR